MDDRKVLNLTKFIALACFTLIFVFSGRADAQTIYEVWTSQIDNQSKDSAFGTCLFRKKLSLVEPVEAEIYIAAKDDYELYINSHLVSQGESIGSPIRHDVKSFLQTGVNLIAIKVVHRNSVTAGLAAKFRVREKGETRWRSLTTDEGWKTHLGVVDRWTEAEFNDQQWESANKLASVSFNADTIQTVDSGFATNQKLANSEPDVANDDSIQVGNENPTVNSAVSSELPITKGVAESTKNAETLEPTPESESADSLDGRFTIDPEFQVQQVMLDSETGSLIAMAFNEFGQLILSKEGGPLMLADVTKEPGDKARIRTLCEQVESCQGILPLNGKIYVTGDGPSGLGLYLLADSNRDGDFEVERVIVPFEGELGEHGPHGIQLGPDGMIYVTVGNGSRSGTNAAKTSPYYHTYEGDLVPRMEDPGGHAAGIKAPGGTIIRTTLDGEFVETVNGGLRNVYDLTFDKYGELFVHDSDLETNIGMAWYRPTRLYHVPNGAELGWRSGWSKFPDYFADVTSPIADTGRGSPSGATIYQHFQFPARYHNALFFADWSEGRILAAYPKQNGAGYEVEVDEFITGRPLNVTDLAVGTDGTLFFCTGGRGTGGGVYRISWTGVVPKELYTYSNEFERVIRMPQPNSAWGRQAIATLRKQLARDWESTLTGVASDHRNEIAYRLRAIELLFFFGPFPSDELVESLAGDQDFNMRARIASLCGVKKRTALNANLDILISDKHPLVRRRAAESFFRLGELPPIGKILAMLESKDPAEATVARRLVERAPINSFQKSILTSEDSTLFTNGAIAILTANPDLDRSYRILARVTHFMDGYLSDQEFVDLLRVAQLALVQGQVDPSKIPGFGARVASEFPAGNAQINKQLAMIMAYLGNATPRLEDYFQNSENDPQDKLFVAMQFQTIGSSLNGDVRFAVIDYLEKAMHAREGSTYRNYISSCIKQLVKKSQQQDQIQKILENGAQWPNAMLQSFFSLQEKLSPEQVTYVIEADKNMPDGGDTTTRRIRLGSIAVLAESKDPKAHDYLREIWQSRPGYRNEISLGLAQDPTGKNWSYLVTSIPILDDTIGLEVVRALLQANRRPKQARQYREIIEMGFRLRDSGALEVSKLMKHWTTKKIGKVSTSGRRWEQELNYWDAWYTNKWPDALPVNAEPLTKIGNYSAGRVLAHLEEFEPRANPAVGRFVFQKANCNACHRVGNEGATFGPDLSNLASRFSRREILQSIIDPSRVVSDQYHSKKILTIDGDQLFGMLIKDSTGDFLLQDTHGKTIRIAEDEIDEITNTDLSSMPEGLLDSLSLDEILHLFAYLDRANGDSRFSQESQFNPANIR